MGRYKIKSIKKYDELSEMERAKIQLTKYEFLSEYIDGIIEKGVDSSSEYKLLRIISRSRANG